MKTLTMIHFVAMICSPLAVSKEEKLYDQSENVQNYIKHSDFIVDISVYEMEWIPATTEFPKAKWVERAIITGVHKGNIPIGTRLEYYNHVEEPPRLFHRRFRTVVEGDLLTFFFARNDGELKDGKYTLDGDGHFRFDRLKGDFADAFLKELKTNPDLKPKGGSVPRE